MEEKNKFSMQILNEEGFVKDEPLNQEQLDIIKQMLQNKYGGTVNILQTVCYIPILTKNGD